LDVGGSSVRAVLVMLLMFPSTVAMAGWLSYDNYEDCMLGKMKGQDKSMYNNADKLCKKQFGVEFAIWIPNVKWSFGSGSIRIDESPPEYEITKGEFMFSDKTCEDSNDANFGKSEVIKFSNGRSLLPPSISCGRAVSFWGKYK
jgi:hypothetical protein